MLFHDMTVRLTKPSSLIPSDTPLLTVPIEPFPSASQDSSLTSDLGLTDAPAPSLTALNTLADRLNEAASASDDGGLDVAPPLDGTLQDHGSTGLETARTFFIGSNNADVIFGTAGDDVIDANGGNDLIFSSDGTDVIDGGTGTDIMQYDFIHSEVGLSVAGLPPGEIKVTKPGAGEDTLSNIERIAMNDGDFIADIAGTQSDNDMIYLIYNATLDRAPDEAGFRFWTDVLATGAAPADNAATPFDNERAIWVAEHFVSTNEFLARIDTNEDGTMSRAELVTGAYEQAFDRAPDTNGFFFWLAQYDQYVSEEASFGASAEARLFAHFALEAESLAATADDYEGGFYFVT
jgi:hypothetical protein